MISESNNNQAFDAYKRQYFRSSTDSTDFILQVKKKISHRRHRRAVRATISLALLSVLGVFVILQKSQNLDIIWQQESLLAHADMLYYTNHDLTDYSINPADLDSIASYTLESETASIYYQLDQETKDNYTMLVELDDSSLEKFFQELREIEVFSRSMKPDNASQEISRQISSRKKALV